MATDLVERELELAQLAAQLDDALSGEGRTLLIEGPAGVGKTRLLMETRTQAADRSATMLMGRASQLEREFPFGVVRQLFEAALAEPELRDRAMAGAAAPAQAVFGALPEADANEGAVDASFAILHGLYWMTLNLAQEHPLVLAIDDLQWCDRPSLRFIAYLARRIDGLPVLVAATVRTGEAPTDEAMMADISQDPATAYIRPGPLSEAGVGALVADRLGPDAEHSFIAACHGTTGGNPLLVRQLLTALASERVEPRAQNARVVQEIGPRAVSRSVLLRLARMPSETIAVARAVAILGESAELPTVAALAELDDTQAATAIATLARAEILRPEAPLGFVHPLVRDAVYHELPPGEREMQHARAARILYDAGAEAAQVGTHLMAIPRRGDDWVTEVLVEAGRSALRRGATENAVGYMQRALDEPPPEDQRPAVLFELGLVEALTNAPASIEHLQAAYDQAPTAEIKAMSAYALARSLLFATSPSAGVHLARQARAEIPQEFTDVQHSLLALEAIGYWFGVTDDTTPRELERYRGEETAGPGPGARMLDAIVAYDLFNNGGHVDDCVRLARRALDDGTLIEYENGLFNIPAMIVLAYGDSDDSLAHWDIAQADAYRRGSLFAKSAADGWRGFTLFYLGELAEAEQLLDLAYEGLRAYGYSERIYHYFVAFHSLTLLRQGDTERAWQSLHRVSDIPERADGPRHWMRAKIELLLAQNRAEEALAASHELERRCVPRLINPATWPYRTLRAQALARLDRRDEAIALAEEELELARRFGAPGIVGRTLIDIGQIKGAEDGIDDLAEAAEVLEQSLCQYERARALAAFGGALRRTRHPTDAREPLRRALELADKCGAAALAEHARSELYATGARPRTEAMAGVGSLTASERRVADLAAEGNSNRDIAQALFVTPKTVEVHLSNAYRKLGIRGRRELPDVLVGTS